MIQAANEFLRDTSTTSPNLSSVRDQSRARVSLPTARLRLILPLALIIPVLASLLGCSAKKPEEPTVGVQVIPVKKATIEQTVTAEAVLFPLQQSAIVPKISAPVKAFYVKRGSRVRKGQLLAVLENRDLAAAAQENQGAYNQAQAAYETATAASLP